MPFDGSTYQSASLSHVDTMVLRGKLCADRLCYAEAARRTTAMISLLRDPNNWCKGVERLPVRHLFFFTRYRLCVMGAIKAVGYDDLVEHEIMRLMPAKYFNCIPNWNDDDTTKHADILRVLRAVKCHFTTRFFELDKELKALA